jgi:hypothetical protein
MALSEKRREAILASLRSGNWIFRRWSGTNRAGYLMHSLEGINNLRETEVDELRNGGIIRPMSRDDVSSSGKAYRNFSFKPYLLSEKTEQP